MNNLEAPLPIEKRRIEERLTLQETKYYVEKRLSVRLVDLTTSNHSSGNSGQIFESTCKLGDLLLKGVSVISDEELYSEVFGILISKDKEKII